MFGQALATTGLGLVLRESIEQKRTGVSEALTTEQQLGAITRECDCDQMLGSDPAARRQFERRHSLGNEP